MAAFNREPTWTDVRFDYGGARVLVTGGSAGLGAGIAASYRAAGAEVTVTGTRPKASDYESDLSAYRYLQLRLNDDASVQAVADACPDLDILVNNAGSANYVPGYNPYDADHFEDTVKINLTGVYRLTKACLPALQKSRWKGGASIVIVNSESAFLANELVPGYGAAKGGLWQLTKSLAVAWAKHNIRVNSVAPGLAESNMTAGMSDAARAPYVNRTPLGRIAWPRDVAGATLFLSSSAASFITGQLLPVDGGHSVMQ
jgi:3-oxoacyl-[acyl-carrier protein] reductase